MLGVTASEAKQSRATHTTLDCHVASLLAATYPRESTLNLSNLIAA
jgi:hypothetical protein